MTVRVAVIGAGVMGSDHARIIAEDVPGTTLQVVCDVSEDAARRVADTFSARHADTDAIAAVERDDVDAVLIASPDNTHADLTHAALKLQKPVLCEKPLALTSSEAMRIVEAENAIGRQLVQVGFMRRFDRGYVDMKNALTSGQIGPAIMMHNFHRNVEAPPSFTGMMAITNSAPHEFDVARYVLDAEMISISAFEPKADGNGDGTGNTKCKPVVMVLESSQGQLVTIEVNVNAVYGYDVRAELVGTSGSVSMSEAVPIHIDSELSSRSSYAADWRPRFANAYRLQNKAWIQSIVTGTPDATAANAWDGYCANVIAEAGVSALSSGKKVHVELPERPTVYCNSGNAT